MQVLREGIAKRDGGRTILFDGVPRDLDQMRDFDASMHELKRDFRCIHLVVPEAVVMERIAKRALEQGRTDDANPEFIQRRIGWFKEKNLKVIDSYAARGKVTEVDGLGTVEEVYARLQTAVKGWAA